ncbi:N-acetylglucosamine kinase [Nonomuraea sediminis]|uniref:N-acetylglucosamine kinase n=1 Tax=Nonomuraea sediminis TaxID=2835864 RepID=UPI0027DEDE9A|nr:BadF/BadG/BcrA/BcrD ATPase family protein [Nonomuraea sediminis]
MEQILLAVDGGNSKTDVALVTTRGEVLATGRSGPFAPQSEGVPAAVDVVVRAVRQAVANLPDAVRQAEAPSEASGVPAFAHVAAYLAGADLPVEEEALAREFTARGFGDDIVVRNDTFALLRSGASGPWGVAVVCGAGINAVGVSPTGQVARFPALGRLSGDWGGGLGLGEEALWHAVRAEDGRGPATALAELLKTHFGAPTVEDVVLRLHFGHLDEADLMDLAPGVLATAAAGDALARSLVERQAEEITVMAEVCLRRLDLLETPTEVILGGGVLAARDPLLTSLLDTSFAQRAPRAKLVVADLPPVVGAALNGLEHLAASEEAKSRLRSHYEHQAHKP